MRPGRVKVAPKKDALTGSWVVTTAVRGMPPFKSLFTFTEDGGLVCSSSFLVPFPPPVTRAVFSASHGGWNRKSNGKFTIAFLALIHDEDAEFLGTASVSGTIQVDETMDSFGGTTRATDLDSDGNVIFSFEASIEAERIRVEP